MSEPILPPLPDEGLHWHALNYRTAHTLDAQACWELLDAYVRAYATAAVMAEREKNAKICEDVPGYGGFGMCADAIRGQWGMGVFDNPAYKTAQREKNKRARALTDSAAIRKE